jgi:asparagine synthase (glutamine-hydrolysing)
VCGIAGIVSFGSVDAGRDATRVHAMMHAIKHRGPDGNGIWQGGDGRFTLGHVRLSILDLSENGKQPMTSASGRWTIVFNGEIYNHARLRRGMPQYPFRGYSDTEVLLASIEAYGLDGALTRAAGMYSFALFDRDTLQLTLVRDRAGEKPLFLARAPDRLVFCSEMRGLLAAGLVQPRLNEAALGPFLQFGYQAVAESLLLDIEQISPGTMICIDCSGPLPQLRELLSSGVRYWRFEPRESTGEEQGPASARLDKTLRAIMPEYLTADVPVGVLLSGGMDSSVVALAARRALEGPIRTYTATFPGTAYDEGQYAQIVNHKIGGIWTPVPLTDESMRNAAEKLLPNADFPIANPSYIPLALVCEAARDDVTVCISGDGGDEVFGGYNRYWLTWKVWRRTGWVPLRVRKSLAVLIERLASAKSGDAGMLHSLLKKRLGSVLSPKLYGLSSVLSSEKLTDAYLELLNTGLPHVFRGLPGITRSITDCADKCSIQDFLDFVRMHDFENYLPGDNLAKADQASMRVSLELRLPLLDRRVLDIGATLPVSGMRRNGLAKWPIASLLEDELGSDFVRRPKMGFSVPLESWLSGGFGEWARGISMDAAGAVQRVVDSKKIETVWKDVQRGQSQAVRFLWATVALNAWWENVRISTHSSDASSVCSVVASS